MKMLYSFWALTLCLCISSAALGQRVVDIPASGDPANPTDIFPAIMGDTTATGERTDNNTVYRLANGATYVTSGRLVNNADWTLHIEAVDLADTENKAILTRQPNSGGSYPDIGRPEGSFTFKNLWIISGEKGPGENHDWGRLRASGANSRVIVQDCIVEKDRGGFIQVRADGLKIYIDNCIFRNGGDRRVLQGNGRGVDARNFYLDTLMMTNTVVHNIQDRLFRSQGATQPHNYLMIDHCTSFNTAGRHGFIQLGQVREAIITNNLFINPIMLGTTPAFTDEQNQPDDATHKVITLDTLYTDTDLTIASNNIFWTQEVTDYWASNDSVSQPGVLSMLVKQQLGADTADAFFSEVVELEGRPQSILQYVSDLYDDPASTDMFDFIVEDSLVAGTGFDSGNLFDFDDFSTCYAASSQSATAGTDGGPIGAVVGCENFTTGIFAANAGALGLQVMPNPVHGTARFAFEQAAPGEVSLAIYDLQGRRLAVVQRGFLPAGGQQLSWEVPTSLTAGLYLARLHSQGKVQTLKFLLN